MEEDLNMTMQERIEELRTKHQDLEKALNDESHRPHPDDVHIATIKKQKLAIKDEIASLEAQA